MKKTTCILFSALLVAILALPSESQAQSFEKGTNVVNLGIGLGSSLRGSGSALPGFSASYERGIWEIGDQIGVVSLGGYAGIKSYRYRYSGYTDRTTYGIVGFRGAFHYVGFTDLPKLDVYAGVMASYNHVSQRSDFDGWMAVADYASRAGMTTFLGGRWYFSDNIAVFSELGYGVAYLNVGASFKF